MISFKSGGVQWGGYTERTGFKGVFYEIRAEDGETITGPCGPTGTFVFGKHQAATALAIIAADGGTIGGVGSPHIYPHHIETTFHVHAADGGAIRACEAFGWGRQQLRFVNITGEGAIEDCGFFGMAQPKEDEAKHQVECVNPNAQNLVIDGHLWDPGRQQFVNGEAQIGRIDAGERIMNVNWNGKKAGQCNQWGCWKDHADGGSDFFAPMTDLADGEYDASPMSNGGATTATAGRFLRARGDDRSYTFRRRR